MITPAEFTTTPVFAWNYESKARVKNNQGGTSSGKTYALLQVIFLRLIEKRRIATIVGQDLPNIKKGAHRDFEERVLENIPFFRSYLLPGAQGFNKTTLTYRFKNGSILEFTSYKDSQDAKSGKRDILFINEAQGVSYTIYEELAKRTTEEIFLDYNPTAPFWVNEHIIGAPNTVTFYSNFSQNIYCPGSIREYLFSLKYKDTEAWEVYGLGKTGTVAELIFKNYTIIDEIPAGLRNEGIGLDFGYTSDPTTGVYCGLANERDIYIDELFYIYKAGPDRVNELIGDKYRALPFYPDPSGFIFISELKKKGLIMREVTKGPGSVIAGLELLLEYNLFITSRSYNILNELSKYKRKIDKISGKVLNEPIDAFNHAIDSIRYWGLYNLKTRRKTRGVRRRN